jgi:hypothetical protein
MIGAPGKVVSSSAIAVPIGARAIPQAKIPITTPARAPSRRPAAPGQAHDARPPSAVPRPAAESIGKVILTSPFCPECGARVVAEFP